MNLHRGRSDMGRSCPPREVYAGPPGACSTMPRLCTPPEPTRDGRAGCGTGLDSLAQMAPSPPPPRVMSAQTLGMGPYLGMRPLQM